MSLLEGRKVRRFTRRRIKTKRKGYDWIATTGDQPITLLDPVANNTLAEFPLITPDEVKEIGEPIIVHRVVGTCWLSGPWRSGEIDGMCQVAWGVRVAQTDSESAVLYLPVDAVGTAGLDASWMFLRHQLLGNLGVPAGLGFPINHVPNVSTGGRHAPQGGPCFDINTKRKMTDADCLTLSVTVGPLLSWAVSGVIDDYQPADIMMTCLHIRALVSAVGR